MFNKNMFFILWKKLLFSKNSTSLVLLNEWLGIHRLCIGRNTMYEVVQSKPTRSILL